MILPLPILTPIPAQVSALAGSDAQAPRTIRGQVVNSITGEPVPRALVQVSGRFATLTDHEGKFEFIDATGTLVTPFAMKPGYFPDPHSRANRLNASGNGPAASEAAGSGGDAGVVVKLVPEAVFSGTVTGQNGEPLQGVPVVLKTLGINNGLNHWNQRHQVTTNAEGQFRFAELEAGRYSLSTSFHVEGLPDSDTASAYVPVQYPAGSIAQPSSALTLAAGDHVEATLTPALEKLYPVSGAIFGFGESRGVSFEIETAGGDPIQVFNRFDSRSGEFRLMLPGGSYQVTATAYVEPGPLRARFSLTVPQAPVRGIAVTLEPSASIPVEVESQAVATSSSSPDPSGRPPFANVSLSNADPATPSIYLGAHTVRHRGEVGYSPDASRPQVIDSIPPGHYFLEASPQPPWYVGSASCGGVDLLRDELVVAGSAAGCGIRIVLRNDSASIHGTLRSAVEAAGETSGRQVSFIYLVPEGDLVRRVQIVPAINGQFSADNLAPGRYLVFALDRHSEIAYRDPEVMRRYASIAQDVTLAPGGNADVDVDVAAGGP